MDKLEKAIKKKDTKKRKRRRGNSDSDFEQGIGSGSIGKVVINLREPCKKTQFTPPSPIKATTKVVTGKGNDLGLTSASNKGDATMMSSTQNKELQVNYSTPANKYPPEGKTTVVVAVMRGKSKHGYHHHCSNKHYKRKQCGSCQTEDLTETQSLLIRQAHIASLLKKAGSTVMECFDWGLPNQA